MSAPPASAAHGAGPRETGVGSFGLQILLVALAVLFASTVIATWYFRDQAAQWGSAVPSLPAGLLITTALLGVLSALVETAARAADRPKRAAGLLAAAGACALLFLVGQGWNWIALAKGRPVSQRPSFYEFNFYLLTLLHAAHVVGGVVFHWIAWSRARARAPGAATAMRQNAIYWHFLAFVWGVILVNLWLTRIQDPAASWLGPTSLILLGATAAACLGYQLLVMAEFVRRGKGGLALASLVPLFALLAFWAYAGEWGRQKRLVRWTLSWLLLLCFLMLATAIHSRQIFGP